MFGSVLEGSIKLCSGCEHIPVGRNFRSAYVRSRMIPYRLQCVTTVKLHGYCNTARLYRSTVEWSRLRLLRTLNRRRSDSGMPTGHLAGTLTRKLAATPSDESVAYK